MFTDPLSVNYNGSSLTLPKVGSFKDRSIYRTADGQLELQIAQALEKQRGYRTVSVKLIKSVPDPTPGDVFDPMRPVFNAFSVVYGFDDVTRYQASVDHPLLRASLLSFIDSPVYGRLIGGEM